MEKCGEGNAGRRLGVSADYRPYSIDPVDGANRECLRQARLSKASAEYQRLEDERLFYAEMARNIPDEAQWDFIRWLEGYSVEMPSRQHRRSAIY